MATILKGSILVDRAGRRYQVDRLEKGFVYILTSPPVANETAIPIPMSFAESLQIEKAAA